MFQSRYMQVASLRTREKVSCSAFGAKEDSRVKGTSELDLHSAWVRASQVLTRINEFQTRTLSYVWMGVYGQV